MSPMVAYFAGIGTVVVALGFGGDMLTSTTVAAQPSVQQRPMQPIIASDTFTSDKKKKAFEKKEAQKKAQRSKPLAGKPKFAPAATTGTAAPELGDEFEDDEPEAVAPERPLGIMDMLFGDQDPPH